MDYQAAFESVLNKVAGVPEATLIAMFVAGLQQPIRREVNLRSPDTLPSAFALARELSACHQDAAVTFGTATRRHWSSRPPPNPSAGLLPTPTAAPKPLVTTARAPDRPPPNPLPVVRLSPAEKAECTKKGLCWYCDEKWVPRHNCKHRFLVLMGPDEGDEEPTVLDIADDVDTPAIITGDVSSVLSLAGISSPRSLKLAGKVNDVPVQVLLDSGSTHNFIHPSVAEKLSLVLYPVTPFWVYVGNDDSMKCSYSYPRTPLFLQDHPFTIDLYLLNIHGPDIVLGVQWLQTLGRAAHDYTKMTMEFEWEGRPITLHGDSEGLKSLSYNQLCSLMGRTQDVHLYELIPSPPTPDASSTVGPSFPEDLPGPIQANLLTIQTSEPLRG
ncbi:unnamed protein product [Cuscuta campestris]|uniref:Retrotransposon gag domain-containing protein n=1 Tax=Cuscuta campestris TaxID=132261 RepID=A0A484KE25_9ASTE|nr:unnamed protein product [Cuscuta campestris]